MMGVGEPQRPVNNQGLTVVCSLIHSKNRIQFEFFISDESPEEIATDIINLQLLPEDRRQFFVEQLVDIASQITEDPETVPKVKSIPPLGPL